MSALNHPDNGNRSEESEPQAVPVFHPIDLNSEDDSEDENDDNNNNKISGLTIPSPTIPALEDSIQDCFLLAVNTHDAPVDDITKAVWGWREQSAGNHPIPVVDRKTEEEALRSWIPRPLFLPSWAVTEE